MCESESEVTESCLTLCGPMDCRLPGSSVHGIFQARVMEWVTISFSGGSSQPRDWTQVSFVVGRRFTIWATREVCVPLKFIHVEILTHKVMELGGRAFGRWLGYEGRSLMYGNSALIKDAWNHPLPFHHVRT